MSIPSVVLTGYSPWQGTTCPDLAVGGVPYLGMPHPDLGGYPTWVPPWQGTLILTWLGGTLPGYPPMAGYPPSRVPPRLDQAEYPPWCLPHGILGNVAKHYGIWVPPSVWPMVFWEMLQSIMGYGYPPCGQTDWWMDRRVSKHYLPVRTTYAGGKNARNVRFCLLYENIDSRWRGSSSGCVFTYVSRRNMFFDNLPTIRKPFTVHVHKLLMFYFSWEPLSHCYCRLKIIS